jgi:hypothetical protein
MYEIKYTMFLGTAGPYTVLRTYKDSTGNGENLVQLCKITFTAIRHS